MLSSLLGMAQLLADGAAAAPGAGPAAPSGLASLMSSPIPMLVMMAALFYFMLWRPQSKKQQEMQDFLKSLKKGDEVVTSGGLIGKISGLTETEVTLEVQEKVRLKVQRSHVVSKYVPGAKAAPAESSATTTTK